MCWDNHQESNSVKKDLGQQAEYESPVKQKKSQHYPGPHQEKCLQQVEGVDLSLPLSTGETCSNLSRSKLPSITERLTYWSESNAGPAKMIRGLEHLLCEERLKELRLSGEEKAQGGSYQHL